MMWSPLNLEVISRYSSLGCFRMRHRKHFPTFQKKVRNVRLEPRGKHKRQQGGVEGYTLKLKK